LVLDSLPDGYLSFDVLLKMARLLLLPIVMLCLAACKQEGSQSASKTESDASDAWYSKWISESRGERFDSEISLAAGEAGEVVISSETPLVIGFIVEKGYEISKDPGTVYMGTTDTPHAVGGSPGTWREFESSDGAVKVRLENASGIPTRLAIYTKPKT
jgi:hypothetical protein